MPRPDPPPQREQSSTSVAHEEPAHGGRSVLSAPATCPVAHSASGVSEGHRSRDQTPLPFVTDADGDSQVNLAILSPALDVALAPGDAAASQRDLQQAFTSLRRSIVPPHARSLPLIGDLLALLHDPVRYAHRHVARVGPVWQSRIRNQRAYFFVGEDFQRLLAQNPLDETGAHLFANRPAYDYLDRWLGRNLLSMEETEHDLHRRLLQPAFSQRLRPAFLRQLNLILAEELGEHLRQDQGSFDFHPIAKRIALRAGAWLVLGLDRHDPRYPAIEQAWNALLPGIFSVVPAWIPGSPQQRALHARDQLTRLLTALIQEEQQRRRQQQEASPQPVVTASASLAEDPAREDPENSTETSWSVLSVLVDALQ